MSMREPRPPRWLPMDFDALADHHSVHHVDHDLSPLLVIRLHPVERVRNSEQLVRVRTKHFRTSC
jgi:hypothetical protein